MESSGYQKCCVTGFAWDGTPSGSVSALGKNPAYVTGSNADVGVLLIHDAFGWQFPNVRLLADHVAHEVGVTVYVPDFFGGEELPTDKLIKGDLAGFDIPAFMARNSRAMREPEIFECARAIRAEKGHKRVGAFGYCFGGWASFRLGAAEHQPPLVDCISMGHPSLVEHKDMDECAVPVQILAPEHDEMFSHGLKSYAFKALTARDMPFDYQHFPGVEHGCMIRGDPAKKGERDAMVRGKDAVVAWFKLFLVNAK